MTGTPSQLETELQTLVRDAEARERTARTRAIFYSVIPVLLAAILIGITVWQVQQAQLQVSNARFELAQVKEQLADVQPQLTTLQQQLEQAKKDLEQVQGALRDAQAQDRQATAAAEAADAQRVRVELALREAQTSFATTQDRLDEAEAELKDRLEKGSYAQYILPPDQLLVTGKLRFDPIGELLNEVIRDQPSVHFSSKASSLVEGFDSPGYATYLLRKHEILGPNETVGELQSVSTPGLGDIEEFAHGYTMFFFQTANKQPFVIGMTPLDILALDPVGLGEPVGYLKIPWERWRPCPGGEVC